MGAAEVILYLPLTLATGGAVVRVVSVEPDTKVVLDLSTDSEHLANANIRR